jgi:hypothetical protein
MSKLPRRPIDPLDPPPGSFDRVLSDARARRRRRGLVVSSSAAVLAVVASSAFVLGSSLGVRDRLISTVSGASSDSPTVTSSTQASHTPSSKRSKSHGTKTAGASGSVVQPSVSYLRGRAVDPEGNPLGGLYVQPGAAGHVTYDSSGYIAARTDENGYFVIGCTRSPVLLASWRLDHAIDSKATEGHWAATFVGGSNTNPVVPSCGTTVHRVVMYPGATVTGTVHAADACAADSTFPLWLWLDGDRDTSVRLRGLREGDTFTFSGLPAGNHVLGASGETHGLSVPFGGEVHQDATFSCRDEQPSGGGTGTESPGTPDPSDSPDPEPTTPEPTPHPTPSGTPSSTGGWQSGEPTGQPASPAMSLSAAE